MYDSGSAQYHMRLINDEWKIFALTPYTKIKNLDSVLPANHPKKELANKKTKFECKILNVKKAKKNTIN